MIKRNCLISVPLYLQRLPDIPFTRRISVISAYFSFIHEYNVEKYNTDRNLIYLLRQDSPMEEGLKVASSTSDAPTKIKEKYTKIKNNMPF